MPLISTDILAQAFLPLLLNEWTYRILAATGFAMLVAYLTRPRRFYFVRHGETLLNAQHIRQGADGKLSENGQRQAHRTGQALSSFPIDRIIASPYERTRETAGIISTYVHAPVAYSDLFAERRNPSEIIGKHADDPAVVKIIDQMDRAYHEDEYRFSDEENFEDLKVRARKALTALEGQPGHHICVVTHRIFLKMLIAYLLYRDHLHASDYAKLDFFNAADNASVTICQYSLWETFSPTRGWKVLVYNAPPPDDRAS